MPEMIKLPVPPWKRKLKSLVKKRKALDDRIQKLTERRDVINGTIIHVLEKQKKRNVGGLAGWRAMRVLPKTITWRERIIFAWYIRKGMRPPTKKVLDLEQLESDIKRKKVPAKMLEKFAKVEKGKEYVRIQKDG